MSIATDILILIRLHKKADLLEMKVNSMKDRKVYVDEKTLTWERKDSIGPVVQAVAQLLWSGRKADESHAVQDFLKP